jgi:uncharacterized protein
MPLFTIPANDIDTAGYPVDAALPTDWLASELADAELTATHAGHFTGRLSRTGLGTGNPNEIVVRGRVRAELTTPCARCMDPAAVNVDTELTLLLKPAPSAAKGPPKADRKRANGNGKAPAKTEEEEYEFTSEEADFDLYDGETIVLDPFIREAILLEVPNFPLCSDACPGIRPVDLERAEPAPAIDPRLAPLNALRERLAAAKKSSAASSPGKKKKE